MKEVLLMNDSDFSAYLKKSINVDITREIAEKFLNLNLTKIKILSNSLNKNIILQILSYEDLIDYEKFKSIFLPSKDDVKKAILENEKYFSTVVLSGINDKNSLFDFLPNDLKLYILNSRTALDKINPDAYIELMKKIKDKDFYEIVDLIAEKGMFKNAIDLSNYIMSNYNLPKEVTDRIIVKYKNGKFNFNLIVKARTEIQVLIFSKFGIIVDAEIAGNFVRFSNDILIRKELIETINEKHLTKLIEELKNKGEKNNNQIFLASIYCYSLFGFANALSIINDKFTFTNDLTLYKSANIEYIDYRRQYRLENQDYFFSYSMMQKSIRALKNKNYKFFKEIYGNADESILFAKLDELYSRLDSEDINEKLSKLLKQIIKEREDSYKQIYIEKYTTYFKNKNTPRKEVSADEICEMFETIDFDKLIFDNNGMPIVNDKLQNFLLGNLKKNNDCLLRLIFNKLAMGLNTTIDVVINNFNKIEDIVDNSNGRLSINSILDVIDVCKTFLYKLQPDEQDITLDDIAKILRSRKYCNETGGDLIIRAKELHKERRKKTSSTIPSVSGTVDEISYKVLNFDDPSLITIGIDTQNCFKIGGLGESFLKYALTDRNSVIVGLYDNNNVFYMCPFIRNGNGIYGNGIDPEPSTNELKSSIIKALQDCAKKIIKLSDESEKIEFMALMDLHQEKFLSETDYQKIQVDNKISIGESFYADYYKKENKCYVIASINNSLVNQNFYSPKISYTQKRIPNYEYRVDKESDKERVQLFVNSIYYSSIDCKKADQREKDAMKRNYAGICVEDFDYIIGNKDWFIAIDRCMNIHSCCLPYDNRAMNEYLTAFAEVKRMYAVNFMEETKKNEK